MLCTETNIRPCSENQHKGYFHKKWPFKVGLTWCVSFVLALCTAANCMLRREGLSFAFEKWPTPALSPPATPNTHFLCALWAPRLCIMEQHQSNTLFESKMHGKILPQKTGDSCPLLGIRAVIFELKIAERRHTGCRNTWATICSSSLKKKKKTNN